MEQRQQGAPIVPAGVVGKVGANETVGEAQFLVHWHTGHLHHHPPVVPAVDWVTETGDGVNTGRISLMLEK